MWTFKAKMPKERFPSFLWSSVLTPSRVLNTQHIPIPACSDVELKDVAPSTTHSFIKHSLSRHLEIQLRRTKLQDATTSMPVCATAGTEDSETVLLKVVPVRVVGSMGWLLPLMQCWTLDLKSPLSTHHWSAPWDTVADATIWPSQLWATAMSFKRMVNLAVESLIDEQSQQLPLKGVWSGKELNIPLRHQREAVNKERWLHLHYVPFPEQQKISLIIGTNVPEMFVPLEVYHGSPNDPIKIRSCLGFAVLVEQMKEQHNSATMFTTSIRQRYGNALVFRSTLSGVHPPNH